jgi:hypothetical protein
MRMRTVSALISAFTLGLSANAMANITLVSQQPNGNGYYLSGVGGPEAENFSIPVHAVLASLHFWGVYDQPVPPVDNFLVAIYASAGNVPQNPPLFITPLVNVDRTMTGAQVDGHDEYEYEGQLEQPVLLARNTPYWIVIVNALDDHPDGTWGWEWSDEGDGMEAYSENGGETWLSDVPDLAFELCFSYICTDFDDLPGPAYNFLVGVEPFRALFGGYSYAGPPAHPFMYLSPPNAWLTPPGGGYGFVLFETPAAAVTFGGLAHPWATWPTYIFACNGSTIVGFDLLWPGEPWKAVNFWGYITGIKVINSDWVQFSAIDNFCYMPYVNGFGW